MGFVTGMLAGMLRRNIDPTLLLAELDIDLADAASRVPLDRYATLYNLVIRELGDEGFGLFSTPMGRGSFEFLCRGMLGAPTLADGLDRARRFLAIVLPDLSVSVNRGDDRAELHIREAAPLTASPNDPARVFAFEWLLRLLHSLSCWLVGRGLALDSVDFPFAPPAHADDYALVYTARSSFIEGPQLTARFNATLLDLPIRRDEAALSSFLEGAPGRISMLYRRDRNTVIRVRDLIRDALPASLTQDEAANRLHMSPRTLHRRLRKKARAFAASRRPCAGTWPWPASPRPASPSPGWPPTWAMPTPRPSTGPSPAGPACRRSATASTSPSPHRIPAAPSLDRDAPRLMPTDLTALTEDLIRDADGLFAGLLRNAMIGIYIIQDELFRYANPRFAEMFGYTQEEICGAIGPKDLIAPGEEAKVRDAIRQRLDGLADTAHYSFEGLRKDGSRIDLEVFGNRTEFDGRPAIIGMLVDITARCAAERTATERLSFIGQLIEAIPSPLFFKDETARYVGCNKAFEAFIMRPRAELIGRSVFDISPPELAARYHEADQALL
jgi:PAS domain S-box-containing protein